MLSDNYYHNFQYRGGNDGNYFFGFHEQWLKHHDHLAWQDLTGGANAIRLYIEVHIFCLIRYTLTEDITYLD